MLTLWRLLLLLGRSRQVLLLLQDEEGGHPQLALHTASGRCKVWLRLCAHGGR